MQKMPRIVLADFDGTLTLNGELSPLFFELIHFLKRKKIPLVIITGRSKATGLFLLQHTPLKHIIVENGGMILSKTKDHRIEEEILVSASGIARIKKVEKTIHLVWADDNSFRTTDRAIDLEKNPAQKINRLRIQLEKANFQTATSSIHFHFTYGKHHKFSSTKILLKRHFPKVALKDCLFFGDSCNDESMFQFLPHSVGVSNIKSHLKKMVYHPSIILKGKGRSEIKGVLYYLNYLKNRRDL